MTSMPLLANVQIRTVVDDTPDHMIATFAWVQTDDQRSLDLGTGYLFELTGNQNWRFVHSDVHQFSAGTDATGHAVVYFDVLTQIPTGLFGDEQSAEQTGSVIFVNLLPGTHHLQVAGGAAIDFTVLVAGLIDFDPSLNNRLSGRGSRTLIVNSLT